MKLKQVKEFNNLTVTQDFAAEIMAICVWNHYRDEKYRNKGFRIANTEPKGVMKGGSKSPWQKGDEEKGYVKTSTGVEIISELEDTLRIFEDGRVMAWWRESDISDFDHIARHKETGKENKITTRNISFTECVSIVQLYLDYGFFKLESDEEKD